MKLVQIDQNNLSDSLRDLDKSEWSHLGPRMRQDLYSIVSCFSLLTGSFEIRIKGNEMTIISNVVDKGFHNSLTEIISSHTIGELNLIYKKSYLDDTSYAEMIKLCMGLKRFKIQIDYSEGILTILIFLN